MTVAPVIAVVGPSGVGKDSVMAALEARAVGFKRARRVITRPVGEDGEDFDRVSEAVFEQMAQRGDFAVHWSAHGMRYGVPLEIEELRKDASAVLVNLSRAVLTQAQGVFGDLVVISLKADPKVLMHRLSERGRESGPEQARRLQRASAPLPQGLQSVIEIDNSGALEHTVDDILARLQLERT